MRVYRFDAGNIEFLSTFLQKDERLSLCEITINIVIYPIIYYKYFLWTASIGDSNLEIKLVSKKIFFILIGSQEVS